MVNIGVIGEATPWDITVLGENLTFTYGGNGGASDPQK